MDLDALRSAGLYDPAAPGSDERLTLLEFLAGEGCTVEEMQVAQGLGHPGDGPVTPFAITPG